jgi:hypothetical protein
VARIIAACSFVFSILHLVTQWVRYHTGTSEMYGVIDLVDMQQEGNLPTLFASLLLLLGAVLLAWIGLDVRARGEPNARHWLGLAAAFALLAVDEGARLHELTIRPLHELMGGAATGLLYWPWVLPAIACLCLLGLIYLQFLRHLDAQTRRGFVIAATLFVGGAVAVEMVEARHVEIHGTDNFGYALWVWVEESLELAGATVFAASLLGHLARRCATIRLRAAAA